jgi:hypothetical protein
MEPEGAPSRLRWYVLDQQSVARCSADSLPETIDCAPDQHNGPDSRDGDHRLAERRESIARGDERASVQAIGDPTSEHLGDRRDALGNAFNQPNHGDRRTEHAREKAARWPCP